VDDGLIGDVNLITADFCLKQPFDPAHRHYDPTLGGGSLLDLGIYPLSFSTMLLGFPDETQTFATVGPTGVDEIALYQLAWNSGARAQLSSALRFDRPVQAVVYGTAGSVTVAPPLYCPDRLVVHLEGEEPRTINLPYRSNGYVHEIDAVHAALEDGRIEVPQQPLDDTSARMRLMDRFRSEWGVSYPSE
jgi:predicted dehydrogenase